MRKHHALIVMAGVATLALAANPHFIFANGTVGLDGALTVDFKEAGLGTNQLVDFVLTTTATATYQCFNNGSNAPQGQPYQVPDQPLEADGTFASGQNGQITASLSAGPPSAAPANAVLKCLGNGNKALCLMHVAYADTVLTDTTNNVSIVVSPSPAERSFPAPSRKTPLPDNCVTSL